MEGKLYSGLELEVWIFFFVVLISVIFIAIFVLVAFLNKSFPPSCDIGKPDVAGDYNQTGWHKYVPTVNQCAVEDCIAYNKIHNDSECLV